MDRPGLGGEDDAGAAAGVGPPCLHRATHASAPPGSRLAKRSQRLIRTPAVSRDRRGATLAGVSPELLVCHLEPVEYREAWPCRSALRARVPGRRAARRAAAARAPAGLHARPPLGRGRAADGRGLVPLAGHRRRRRPTAAASSPTTAPASSSATRSCASRTSSPTCARWRRRSSPRWPTRASRRGAPRGRDFTGVWVGGPQDRLDRRPRVARRHDPRLRDQRRQRPAAVRVGRAVRAARRCG